MAAEAILDDVRGGVDLPKDDAPRRRRSWRSRQEGGRGGPMGTQEAARGLIGNTDASGQVGRRVAERLARRGLRQRLLVQDRSQAPDLPRSEVTTISYYGNAESMHQGVAGVETLLLIPIKEHPERVRMHQTAVDAAVAAGVKRIVYSSFLGAAADVTFTFARDHYATEQHIRSKGVAFTFLRGSAPSWRSSTFLSARTG
jgi:NAD(P)H dehydrogenase (quinone)